MRALTWNSTNGSAPLQLAPLLSLLNFKSFLRPYSWAMPVSRIFLLFSETAFLKRIWTGSGKKIWAPKRLLKFSVKCHTSFHELAENLCNEDVISQNKTENICNLHVHICHLKNKWYFVSKIVLTYCEKFLSARMRQLALLQIVFCWSLSPRLSQITQNQHPHIQNPPNIHSQRIPIQFQYNS